MANTGSQQQPLPSPQDTPIYKPTKPDGPSKPGQTRWWDWTQGWRTDEPPTTPAKDRPKVRSAAGRTQVATPPEAAAQPAPPRRPPEVDCEVVGSVVGAIAPGQYAEYKVVKTAVRRGVVGLVSVQDILAHCCADKDPARLAASVRASLEGLGDVTAIGAGQSIEVFCYHAPSKEPALPVELPCDCLGQLILALFHRTTHEPYDGRPQLNALLKVLGLMMHQAMRGSSGDDATDIDMAMRKAIQEADDAGVNPDPTKCKKQVASMHVPTSLTPSAAFDLMEKIALARDLDAAEAIKDVHTNPKLRFELAMGRAAKSAWATAKSVQGTPEYQSYLDRANRLAQLKAWLEQANALDHMQPGNGVSKEIYRWFDTRDMLRDALGFFTAPVKHVREMPKRDYSEDGESVRDRMEYFLAHPVRLDDADQAWFDGFVQRPASEGVAAEMPTLIKELSEPSFFLDPLGWWAKELDQAAGSKIWTDEELSESWSLWGISRVWAVAWMVARGVVGIAEFFEKAITDPAGLAGGIWEQFSERREHIKQAFGGDYTALAALTVAFDMIGVTSLSESLMGYDSRTGGVVKGLKAWEKGLEGFRDLATTFITPQGAANLWKRIKGKKMCPAPGVKGTFKGAKVEFTPESGGVRPGVHEGMHTTGKPDASRPGVKPEGPPLSGAVHEGMHPVDQPPKAPKPSQPDLARPTNAFEPQKPPRPDATAEPAPSGAKEPMHPTDPKGTAGVLEHPPDVPPAHDPGMPIDEAIRKNQPRKQAVEPAVPGTDGATIPPPHPDVQVKPKVGEPGGKPVAHYFGNGWPLDGTSQNVAKPQTPKKPFGARQEVKSLIPQTVEAVAGGQIPHAAKQQAGIKASTDKGGSPPPPPPGGSLPPSEGMPAYNAKQPSGAPPHHIPGVDQPLPSASALPESPYPPPQDVALPGGSEGVMGLPLDERPSVLAKRVAIMEKLEELIQRGELVKDLLELDPNAEVGIRGSTVVGDNSVKAVDRGLPVELWNPGFFDLDVFIRSQQLYELFRHVANYADDGVLLDTLGSVRDKLATRFPELFEKLKKGDAGFSIMIFRESADLGDYFIIFRR